MRNFTALFLMFFASYAFSQQVVFEDFPKDKQLYQRNVATNSVNVPVTGYVLASSGFERLKLTFSNEQGVISETERRLNYNTTGRGVFSFQVNIPAERNNHEVTISGFRNSNWELVETAVDVLAGDIFIILGQSNAEAGAAPDLSDVDEYTRSWFLPYEWGTLNLSFPGQWGARIAKVISEQENLPVAIFNQAIGAEPITTFLRDDANPLNGNYGDLLKRFDDAGLERKARGAFWFQGETDAWTTDPEEYFNNFEKLKRAWEQDYDIERTFVFQMRYQSCSSPGAEILEAHRRFNEELPRVDVLSTLNADHDSCHFYYENGYKLLAERMANIMTNRLYNGNDPLAYSPSPDYAQLSPSNSRILEIYFKNNAQLSLVGNFPAADFGLVNTPVKITGGRVNGSKIELFLDGELEFSSGVNYLGHLGAAPGWITNTAGVGAFTFYGFPINGVPDLGPDLNCYADISVNGLEVTVSNFDAPIRSLKLLDASFQAFYSCDNWGGTNCGSTETITLPSPGDYHVRVQTFFDFSMEICNILLPITGTIDTTDPCQNSGGDTDGDGVCNAEDCQPNNPNASFPGDACNDFNTTTINDVIQADCSCRGTVPPPCASFGGDADGDGFCADVDCNDNNPNLNQPGDICNDGNPLTINDRLQADCFCRGEIPAPCSDAGGDADGDGVCADEDCDDNDPLISHPGDACDDGDANTENDVILSDCSCHGVILPPCASAGGDADGDGVCFDEDCDDRNPMVSQLGDACNDNDPTTENDVILSNCDCAGTPIVAPTGCDVTYVLVGDEIRVSNIDSPINFVKIMDANFLQVFNCNSWSQNCTDAMVYKVPEPGIYYLQIETLSDWAAAPTCDIFERFEVTEMVDNCQNVTNGGQINGDEDLCLGDPSARIRTTAFPSGGIGGVNYQWLSSTAGCPTDLSDAISGATRSTYRPSNLSQTTYFRRLSKREDCTSWLGGESNCVVKTVEDCTVLPPAGCTAEYVIGNNNLTVSGLNYPIASIRVTKEDLIEEVFKCNSWVSSCNDPLSIPLAPGTYYLSVQTFETWADQKCDILEKFEISGSAIQNNSISLRENNNTPFGKIAVFPNPVQGELNISLPAFAEKSEQNVQIKFIDQLGRQHADYNIKNSGELITLPTDNLTAGIYHVWISPEGAKAVTKRILVQKY